MKNIYNQKLKLIFSWLLNPKVKGPSIYFLMSSVASFFNFRLSLKAINPVKYLCMYSGHSSSLWVEFTSGSSVAGLGFQLTALSVEEELGKSL